jgi:hypothetical protein
MKILCQSRLSKADHVYLIYVMLQQQLSHLNGRKFDRAMFKLPNICVCLRLVLCCEHDHSYDFLWLLLVACIVLLYNVYTWEAESLGQIADPCALWKVSSGAEIIVLQSAQIQKEDIYLKFPGGPSISHYWSNQFFRKGQFNLSAYTFTSA